MNRKTTVSNDIIKARYIQEVLGGSKTGKELAVELGISGSRLSRIVNRKSTPVTNEGKTILVSVVKDAKAKDIADNILVDALGDLKELQDALRGGGTEGKTKALGLVHKVIRLIEVAKHEPDITQIDARTQVMNITQIQLDAVLRAALEYIPAEKQEEFGVRIKELEMKDI